MTNPNLAFPGAFFSKTHIPRFILLLFLFISTNALGQSVLKGQVTDKSGRPIPGVRVYVKETTYGVITNYNGSYFLELNAAKKYEVTFSMIGMEDTTISINTGSNKLNRDIVMLTSDNELNTVEVYADKVDLAKKVIKKVQANRKKMANQFGNYTCKTYHISKIEKEAVGMPDSLMEKQADYMKEYINEIDLRESYSELKFKQPGHFSENIIACNDFFRTSKNVQLSGENVSSFVHHGLRPKQTVEVNPYLFFGKVEDGDFDLYQNMINLPKISEYPITSPIGIQAFTNYKFIYKATFIEGDHKIYEIEVVPKFEKAPLVSGTLFIIEGLWVIKSFNLKINSAALSFLENLSCIQDYEIIDDFWVPVRREYVYTVSEGYIASTGNTRINHSDFSFNINDLSKNTSTKTLQYNDDAFDKDTLFWNRIRPIALHTEEINFIQEKINEEEYKKSKVYLDSIDALYNKITFWDIAIWGIDKRYRSKGLNFYFSSPFFGAINPVGVGGFRYAYNVNVTKKFDNAQKLSVDTWLNYGFYNRDLRGRGTLKYTFLPKQFAAFTVSAGNVYDLINYYNSIKGTFSRGNFVQKRFFEVGQSLEIVNGLYGKLSMSYSDRSEITGLKLSDWSEKVFGELNEPEPFKRYKIAMIDLRLSYRFRQKYEIKNNEKLIIGSKYPELEFTYRKGIPDLFDSEVNFDFIEIGASDNITFGNYGNAKWRAIGGSFINEQSLRFMEHKFFRGSDPWFFSSPMYSQQLLDSTFNTSKPYFQGFYIHHFNGLIMNKLPLIKYLGLELTVGGSSLLIQDANYLHSEFYFGIDKKFKIGEQLMKVILYGVTRVNNQGKPDFQLKIGFDLYDSYTNSWMN